MNSKNLFIIIVVAIVSLLIGSAILSSEKGTKNFEQQKLITDFDLSLIDKIEIQTYDKSLKAEKILGQWQLPEKQGYPLALTKLVELTQALNEAEIVELKTKLKKNFHRLGLENIDEQGSESKKLTLYSADNKISLIIGNAAKSGNGQYVRFENGQQSYLIDQSFDLSMEMAAWLKQDMFNYGFDALRQLTIRPENASSFVIARKPLPQNSENPSETLNLPTGEVEYEIDFSLIEPSPAQVMDKTLKYSSIFSGLVRNVLNIKVQDVELFNEISLKGKVKEQEIEVSPIAGGNIILSFYKTNSDTPNYWLHQKGGTWLINISEFDYKQVNKAFAEYFDG